MNDLGKRVDFHTHSIFSDGLLLPGALGREAEILGHAGIAITDHVDFSNLDFVLARLLEYVKQQNDSGIIVLAGVEISYIMPKDILKLAERARKLGAQVVGVHGQSPVEPVYEGTNRAAVSGKGLIDFLAHPGFIKEEDVLSAKENGICLELSSRKGHCLTNGYVAKLASKIGAKMLVNTDAHSHEDLITQEKAFKVALGAGLSEKEALAVVKENPQELLLKIGIKVV